MRLFSITAALALVLAADAHADSCPPAVTLAGDPVLVSAIGDVLLGRGIAIDPAQCPSVQARIERRDGELAVMIDSPDGALVERVVREVVTAATVIESFTRHDVGTPLLAIRSIPTAARAPRELDPMPVRVAPRSRSGAHVFSAVESAYASDHTGWLGLQVGGCIMLGPVCPAARFRVGAVAFGSGPWRQAYVRRASELLVGIDIPLSVGGLLVSPGFAMGMGGVKTRAERTGMFTGTGGIHADVHATVSIPISRRWALDVSVSGDLAQATEVDSHEVIRGADTMEPMPPEPWALVRLGIGLRFGAR